MNDFFPNLFKLSTHTHSQVSPYAGRLDATKFYPFIFLFLIGYGALAFTEKLKIWHPIIKGLQTNNLNRYSTYLVSGILRKIQFRYDPDLKELDNETVDDDVSKFMRMISVSIKSHAQFLDGNRVATIFDAMH